jgi:hypothetical protein
MTPSRCASALTRRCVVRWWSDVAAPGSTTPCPAAPTAARSGCASRRTAAQAQTVWRVWSAAPKPRPKPCRDVAPRAVPEVVPARRPVLVRCRRASGRAGQRFRAAAASVRRHLRTVQPVVWDFSDCVQLVVGHLVSCLSGARSGTAAQACLLDARDHTADADAGGVYRGQVLVSPLIRGTLRPVTRCPAVGRPRCRRAISFVLRAAWGESPVLPDMVR